MNEHQQIRLRAGRSGAKQPLVGPQSLLSWSCHYPPRQTLLHAVTADSISEVHAGGVSVMLEGLFPPRSCAGEMIRQQPQLAEERQPWRPCRLALPHRSTQRLEMAASESTFQGREPSSCTVTLTYALEKHARNAPLSFLRSASWRPSAVLAFAPCAAARSAASLQALLLAVLER
jgi:hypothetical protein